MPTKCRSRPGSAAPVELLLLAFLAVACSTAHDRATEQTGAATLELRSVPPGVSCIRIDVVGAGQTRSEKFDVTPGPDAVLTLERLPLGELTFSGAAFAAECREVAATTAPDWVSDPVIARVERGQITRIMLVMRRGGRGVIEVRFDEEDAGAECGQQPPPRVRGNCGIERAFCDAVTRQWRFTGLCEGEGDCRPGQSRACLTPTGATEVCATDCRWSDCLCPGGGQSCDDRCVDLDSDVLHCGACGTACDPQLTCQAGRCQCPTPLSFCGRCVNTSSDPDHCGMCGNVCISEQTCREGQCLCPPGLLRCDDACVDIRDDVRHCGACNSVCGLGQTCELGQCVCTPGALLCNGQCVDPRTNSQHCGQCARECTPDLVCVDGDCVQP